MSEPVIMKALYASVVEDDEDGQLFIGFAEGEDDSEPYVLFRQSLEGGPIWFEAGDEDLGAFDAVQRVTRDGKGIRIEIRPEAQADFAFLDAIEVRISVMTEDGDFALEELRKMLGDRFEG